MNVEKMTERVREALNASYERALREHNSSVEPEHVLAALLAQDQGIVPALLEKADIDPAPSVRRSTPRFGAAAHVGANAASSKPRFSGKANRVLLQAGDEATS